MFTTAEINKMFDDAIITKAIVERFSERYLNCLESDVVIVGSGPSGLVAALKLAKRGVKTTVMERKLSTGGGIWGGGMLMSEVVVQEEVKVFLEELGVGLRKYSDELYTCDSIELAAALTFHAVKAGAVILNMHHVEDVILNNNKVAGVVVNRTNVIGQFPVDPLMFTAKVVVDGTGHDAVVVGHLKRRGIIDAVMADGPMNAPEGEAFVVEKTGEIYPGLFVAGMSVCAAYGGPRMGPIFGGMILSGLKAAEIIAKKLEA